MVTTDHISPAGNIQKESPTGEYFMKHPNFTQKIIIHMDLEEEIMR